jgi:hypothetical protein
MFLRFKVIQTRGIRRVREEQVGVSGIVVIVKVG